MFRSSFLAIVVASGAAVLATSVVPAVPAHTPAAEPVGRADDAAGAGAGPSPPERQGGSSPRGRGAVALTSQTGPTALAPPGPVSDDRARWRWPLRPRPAVLQPFRAPESTYGAGHRGLDLATGDGAPVLAVEGGVVSHAGVVAGRGTVTVSHVGGLSSTYEPVDPVVVEGAVVSAGDVLGTLRVRDGPAHCGGRACLHLGARRAGAYLDPYPLLAGGRPVLLPLR